MKNLPYFTEGVVVEGFGRGSKDLGCPTANLPSEVVNKLPQDLVTGVYFGYALVESDVVRKMVMSIGWNPYFKNEQKSMEVHIIHKFDSDFYGKRLKIVILGYIRPEKNFDTLDELIKAIKDDIDQANKRLDEPQQASFKTHQFFSDS